LAGVLSSLITTYTATVYGSGWPTNLLGYR